MIIKDVALSDPTNQIAGIILRQKIRQKAMAPRPGIDAAPSYNHNPKTDIAAIPVTIKKQEAYRFHADVTKYAMEDGSRVTDHVILDPLQIDVSFEVSNLYAESRLNPKYVFNLLTAAYKSRQAVQLATAHAILDNMVMTDLDIKNSVPEWMKLDCRASFTQLKYVKLELVDIDSSKVAFTDKTSGPDNSKSSAGDAKKGNKDIKPDPPDKNRAAFETLFGKTSPAADKFLAAISNKPNMIGSVKALYELLGSYM